MALLSLEGTYENGRVELVELPEGVTRAKVVVTFLPSNASGDPKEREDLRLRFLARLKRGQDFGTEALPKREELYAERISKF